MKRNIWRVRITQLAKVAFYPFSFLHVWVLISDKKTPKSQESRTAVHSMRLEPFRWLSHLLAQPLMSLNEQCGLPVRTFGRAAVAQPVNFPPPAHSDQKPAVSAHIFLHLNFWSWILIAPPNLLGFLEGNFLRGRTKRGKMVLLLCKDVLERGAFARSFPPQWIDTCFN